jgi:FKBP-type peptidyl-prolyl cis-trans isomerase
MKLSLVRAVPAALVLVLLAGCGDKDAKSAKALESVEQRSSYALGYGIGKDLKQQPGLTVDAKAFATGLEDALADQKLRLDEKVIQAAMQEVQKRAQAKMEEMARTNLTAANDFLAKNKTKTGVKTTMSGLQYEVLKKGAGGAKPKATSKVRVHYHGTLVDGTVFDSSVQRGQPIEFALNGVIPGWTEGLQLMSVGDKFKFYVPPGLAYGPRGNQRIPPNSALVFEVELLAIN